MARYSKYKAKPTEVDGIRFDSQREARRYQELKLMERAGEIERLTLQPSFELRSAVSELRIGAYVADFRYYDHRTGETITEDAKGFRTALYRWKKKHVEAQYGIQIREV